MAFRCKISASKICLIFFLLIWTFATFAFLLPAWCSRYPKWCHWRVVAYFDITTPSNTVLDEENFERAKNALRILNENRLPPAKSADATLIFAIITTRRNYPAGKALRYLTQVTAQLVKFVSETKAASLLVCNVDKNPDAFLEASHMAQYVPMVTMYRNASTVENSTKYSDIFEQEKSAYSFCLRTAAREISSSENGYVAIFQDDALPTDNFASDFRSIISQMESRKLRLHDRLSKILYAKLYHPEIYRKLPWLILIFTYSTAFVWLLFWASGKMLYDQNQFRCKCLFWIWLWLYVTILLWCTGHDAVAFIRYKLTGGQPYLISQESCCIPAVIYPKVSVMEVVDFLDAHPGEKDFTVDHMLDQLPGLMTDVNLVRHIGRYTTLRQFPVRADWW